jgi:5'-AMP-activated protein kinase regulatory beta subunit
MGNITGKGDGEDGQTEGALDAYSHAPLPSTSVNVASPPVTSSTTHGTLGGSAPRKKLADAEQPTGAHQHSSSHTHDEDPHAVLERVFGDKGIPMVFRWEAGGDDVFITGTFNNWSAKIPMARSGNDFVHIHELSRSKHAYKFIVDDEWRFTSDQHTMADKSGNINNFLDLTDFKPKFENLPDLPSSLASKYLDETLYGNRIPDINEYTREPPTLPPHLRSIVLNYKSGVPQHVTLDHLYCTARKDGLMVLGMSQRYQHKYVTTIYYSPVNGGFPSLVPGNKRSTAASASVASSSSSGTLSSASTSAKSASSSTGGQKRPFGQ